MFGNRRAVSPILATVLLLGITVVGGGLAYSLMAQGSNTASSQNIITLENAQAIKGTSHADLTATIKNGGSIPWKTVEMTVAKSELSEPILYEALHENVRGCTTASDGCYTGGLPSGVNLDNPLRAQWIAHLDITGGTKDIADRGEGISAGRKFVISTNDPSIRTVLIPNGTSVYEQMKNNPASERTSSNINAITPSVWCSPTTGSPVDCSAYFNALDSGTIKSGEYAFCKEVSNGMECKVLSHRKITSPIQSGQSVQIYADAFTKTVPGLNNQFVQNGDGLVVNIVSEAENGSTARYQTVIKVVGI
jgi:flagellin-like protein